MPDDSGNCDANRQSNQTSADVFVNVARNDARALILKAIVALAMLAGMLLSRNLWYPSSIRTYPSIPLWDWLPAIPRWLGRVWFATLLGLLVVIAVVPRARIFLLLFVFLATLLALWDQTRWQPWFYQYVFMLLCLGFQSRPGSEGSLGRRQAALNACRIVVAGTYIWSGLQKFNFSFATSVFPWLIEPIVPPVARPLAHTGALLIPILETAIGIGLLMPRYRSLAVLLGLGMHALILFCLGPLGHNWNTVVWPWNGAMSAIVITLFWSTPALRFQTIVWPGLSSLQWLALLLFGIMPAFSFLEKWDAYLSAALYSGNTVEAQISVSRYGYDEMPPEIQDRLILNYYGRHELDTVGWSMAELNVPPYPAERVYRKIARHVAAHTDPTDVVLVIRHPPHWLTGQRTETACRVDELDR